MEYALILGLVVLLVIFAIDAVASQTITMWNNISTKTTAAVGSQ